MKKVKLAVKKVKENKKATMICGGVLLAGLLGCCSWLAMRPEVGVIDFNVVQEKAKVYQYILAEQNKYAEQVRIRIMADSKDIEADAKKLEAKKDKMKPEELQRKLRDLEKRALKVQEKYRPTMERIMFASQLASNSISKEIIQVFKETAESEGMKILLPKNNTFHACESVDVTDEFVENLDKVIQTVAYPDPAKIGQ